MSVSTLNDIFYTVVESQRERIMMRRQAIDWVAISSQELYRDVGGVALALQSWGFGKGDRIAILAENRPEWAIADFACQLIGAVTVPIYSTLTGQQTAFILNDSRCRAIFVSTEQQLLKIQGILEETALQRVIVMDPVETAHAVHMEGLMLTGPLQPDSALDSSARQVAASDLATIIYTSGTTGTSKGVMLSHRNLVSNIEYSLKGFDLAGEQICVSFLPLSHVTARHVDLAMLFQGVVLAYCPFIDQLPRALQEVRPTMFVAVPRVYEKIYMQADLKAQGFPKRTIFQWALAQGRTHRTEVLAGRTPASLSWKLANRLVYSKVREGMGGRVLCFISGGAPLGRELAEWYACMGIRIHEGYGLTETSPVIAVNTPGAHRLGTVGKPLPNLEVRIAEDGEILVRGPSVFQGYWNRPEDTANAFVDGWFRTGDIGHVDEDGFLSVTDRKKDLLKTSGGKFIAPQPIENSLKHNALIAEAVVLGDRRKFPAVLISPYFPLLEEWARKNQISFGSRQELVAHSKVQALYDGIVADFNENLARFEKLKKVLLVADEFSIADGTLTASMKLRRRAIEERYRDVIEGMYEETGTTPLVDHISG